MQTLLHLLLAMAVVVMPLLLAWWLVARGEARRKRGPRRAAPPGRGQPPGRDNIEP